MYKIKKFEQSGWLYCFLQRNERTLPYSVTINGFTDNSNISQKIRISKGNNPIKFLFNLVTIDDAIHYMIHLNIKDA